MRTYRVAVVGATGLVGQEILKVLEQRNFPISDFVPLASSRSAGKKIEFRDDEYSVQETTDQSFENVELAFFAGAEESKVSEQFAWEAVRKGSLVIDNSSVFRMDDNVPLVVPEVNPQDLEWHKGLVANPNCSTIQFVMVLAPLHKVATVKRVVVSTYQSVSGWGKAAMEELESQTREIMAGKDPKVNRNILPHQIGFNVIPQIDRFLPGGYTKEEMKMVNETKKIMKGVNEGDKIKITATAVRVPVFVGHSESVNIETEKKLSPEEASEILKASPGVKVIDEPENLRYPMPLEAAGKDEVLVGRIREDDTVENGLNLWIVADNLRKGAALNAVQIAEEMIQMGLI